VFKDANAAAASSPTSELNLDNRERFSILKEWTWVMGPTAANQSGQTLTDDGSQCLSFSTFVKLKGLESVYNATNGGGIADVTSGSLLMLFVCDVNSTSGAWAMSYSSRLRYYD